jgi:hypothetical protein
MRKKKRFNGAPSRFEDTEILTAANADKRVQRDLFGCFMIVSHGSREPF